MNKKIAYEIIKNLGKAFDTKATTVTGLAFAIKHESQMPKEVLQAKEIVKEDITNYMIQS